jgi:cytochrome c2
MNIYGAMIVFFLFNLSVAGANQPLTITSLTKTIVLSETKLNQLNLEHIRMNYSRAYPGLMMDYDGIRLCDLLNDYSINPLHTLEFIAKDNFSVLIQAKYVLNCTDKDSVAYLVIEPDYKWPILSNHTNTTGGPYAIIWKNPERSHISDEYWAWSVINIVEHSKVNESIVIAPPQNIPPNREDRILNGYKVYVSHCSSCHTINHKGQASIGPDLGTPKNIFDYYPDVQQLKKFIRNPQSVRKLPKGRMSGSSYIGLNNNELDDLINYFKFMVQNPVKHSDLFNTRNDS